MSRGLSGVPFNIGVEILTFFSWGCLFDHLVQLLVLLMGRFVMLRFEKDTRKAGGIPKLLTRFKTLGTYLQYAGYYMLPPTLRFT